MRGECAQIRERRECHQQIADSLQPQNQDAPGCTRPLAPPKRSRQCGHGTERPIRGRNEGTLAAIGDVQWH